MKWFLQLDIFIEEVQLLTRKMYQNKLLFLLSITLLTISSLHCLNKPAPKLFFLLKTVILSFYLQMWLLSAFIFPSFSFQFPSNAIRRLILPVSKTIWFSSYYFGNSITSQNLFNVPNASIIILLNIYASLHGL